MLKLFSSPWQQCLLFFLALLVGSVLPVRVPVDLGTKTDTEQTTFSLSKDHPAVQTIAIPEGRVSGMSVHGQLLARTPQKARLLLRITDANNPEKVLREKEADATSLYDGTGYRFVFPPLPKTEQGRYRIELSAPTLSTAQAVSLFVYTKDRYPGGELLEETNEPRDLVFDVFVSKPFIASLFHAVTTRDTVPEDIHLAWQEGGNLAAGKNPYARVGQRSTLVNDQYPTYLPLFYLFAAATEKLSLHDYTAWIAFWRPVCLFFHLLIGATLFMWFARRGNILLACFAALFFLLNRWSVYVVSVALFDPIAIWCFLVSALLARRSPYLSGTLLGISLSLRQMAVFLIPLYLLFAWQQRKSWRHVFAVTCAIACVPLLVSLPFLFWDAHGFARALLFSLTRLPLDHLGIPSADALAGAVGIPAKFFLLLLFLCVYGLFWQRNVGFFGAIVLLLLAFLDFHSVFFKQYMVWALPFLPLAVGEWIGKNKSCTLET